jgi:hypothetical protein
MRTDQPVRCKFEGELSALIAAKQSSRDERARYALFEALSELEGRARTGGASDLTLRKIAELRFLAGILRESVRPFPVAPLRTVLRVRERLEERRGAWVTEPADLDGV